MNQRLPPRNASHRPVRAAALLAVFLAGPWAQLALAQPATGPSGLATTVTTQLLERKLGEVDASTTLNDDEKARAKELYTRALSHLEAQKSYRQNAALYESARDTARQKAEALEAALEKLRVGDEGTTPDLPETADLDQTVQALDQERANLASLQAALSRQRTQLQEQADRPNAARARLLEARTKKDEITALLDAKPSDGESPAMSEAQRWVLIAEAQRLDAENAMLDLELASRPMRIDLMTAQTERDAEDAKRTEARVKLLEQRVNERRLTQAEFALREAEQIRLAAADKHPVIQEIALANAALIVEVTRLAAEMERVTGRRNELIASAAQIEEDFRTGQQKLQVAGLSATLGQLLREQRLRLPSLRSLQRAMADNENRLGAASLQLIDLKDDRRQLRDLDQFVTTRLEALPEGDAARDEGEPREILESELLEQARTRRRLLQTAIDTQVAHVNAINELDFAQRRLLDAVEGYDEFLNERLLWLSTSGPLTFSALKSLPAEVAAFLSPADWAETFGILLARTASSPLPGMLFVIVTVLLAFRRRIRNALKATGEFVGNPLKDSLSATLRALADTLLLAAPLPLLLAGVGWQLWVSPGTDFSHGVAIGLLGVATPLFHLTTFRVLCVVGGVGQAHFGWRDATLKILRREIDFQLIVFPPTAFVTLTVIAQNGPEGGGTLGMLAYALLMIFLALFFGRTLRPGRGALTMYNREHPGGLVARWKKLWYPLLVLTPPFLASLALFGFLYTAGDFTERLVNTLWLVLALLVIHQFVVRWLLMARRRLAVRAARERLEARRAAAESQAGGHEGGEDTPREEELLNVDLATLDSDARNLLAWGMGLFGTAGIWVIWASVFPALRVLDSVSLWEYTAVVDGASALVPLTLADLGLALLIGVIGLVLAKGLPAIIEVALLQRVTMLAGTRYAIVTLLRYTLGGITIVLVLGRMGASWSNIQWAVAALSVGIGFGLQEIIANFVCGIILLFERPIRVGDVVTVGDTSGTVTRIQMRATTIRGWDRKELLVPNKEFITGRLLNWSLSDSTTRILLTVGVAYGSDTARALQLLTRIAREHPLIVDDPEPFSTFEGFGDNSLTLNLRCYIASLDQRLATITDLHATIDREFKEAGIVIAFPQRDLHFDAGAPLEIRLSRDKPAGPPAT